MNIARMNNVFSHLRAAALIRVPDMNGVIERAAGDGRFTD
jgi:hypothetical protein